MLIHSRKSSVVRCCLLEWNRYTSHHWIRPNCNMPTINVSASRDQRMLHQDPRHAVLTGTTCCHQHAKLELVPAAHMNRSTCTPLLSLAASVSPGICERVARWHLNNDRGSHGRGSSAWKIAEQRHCQVSTVGNIQLKILTKWVCVDNKIRTWVTAALLSVEVSWCQKQFWALPVVGAAS